MFIKVKIKAPGPYQIKYVHLKLIDMNRLLIKTILGAVHRLGDTIIW